PLLLLADPQRVRIEVDPGQDEVDVIEAKGPAPPAARFQDADRSLAAGIAADPRADDLVDCWLVRQDGDRGRTHGDLSSVQDGDRKESGADRARRQSPTAGGATAQFVGAGFQPPNYCVL